MHFDYGTEDLPQSILTWKFSFDNPTILGWTVVAVYLVAAVCCGRAALKSREHSTRSLTFIWWAFAVVLVMLGINKQLNLQTLMIVIGQNISNSGDWYGARRQAQLIFALFFAAFSIAALIWLWRQYGPFFRENQLIIAGAIILVLFVVLRAASINHTFALPIFGFKDDQWAWILEITGSALIATGALRRTAGHHLE